MAAEKLTQLTATGAPQPTDKMYIVRPSAGLAGSFSILNNDLFSLITQNITDKALRFEQVAPTPFPPFGVGSLVFFNDGIRPRFFMGDGDGATPYFTVGDVAGPQWEGHPVPVANAIAFFQSITGRDRIRAMTLTTADGQTFAYATDTRQIFSPGATTPGVNVGSINTNPSGAANGDIWYNTATNSLNAFINGQIVNLGQAPTGVGRALPPNTTAVSSVAPQSTLHTVTVPANTLKSNGDYFRFNCGGTLANNNNAKGMVVQIGGTASAILSEQPPLPIIGTPGAGTVGSTALGGWKFFGECIRTSSNSANIGVSLIFGVSKFDSSGVNTGSGSIIVSRNFSNVITATGFDWATTQFLLLVIGIGAVDGDLTQNLTTIEVYNF